MVAMPTHTYQRNSTMLHVLRKYIYFAALIHLLLIIKMKQFLTLCLVGAFALALTSCSKKEDVAADTGVPADVMQQIAAMGFNTNGVVATEGGYLVEGDIFMSAADLANGQMKLALRVGDVEQYRTTNLVSGLPRTITLRVSTTLPSAYVTAVNEVVRRYNAENLLLRFSRVTSGGNIVFTTAPSGAGYLASAGFPSGGNPFNSVRVNSAFLGSNPGTNYLATILAHEVGHCIGFRHTDYMDRSYSCGGAFSNEGASTVGAIRIPGTPASADPNSWMLACVGNGVNRPFNSNDRIALNFLY